ncbi:hypothetical protein CsatB_011874 [Cannabis sativa]
MAKSYSSSSASSSSSPTIEITILSGESLRIDNRFIKKNAFVIVRSNSRNVFQTTEIDTKGGSNPNWNEKLVLDLPAVHHAAALTVEVHCRTAIGNRLIGTASVPMSDFSGGYLPENYLHFLSYRLRDQNGERNGIINLSVKTKSEYRSCAASSSASMGSSSVVGVPAGKNNMSGVVTGFPVWSASY